MIERQIVKQLSQLALLHPGTRGDEVFVYAHRRRKYARIIAHKAFEQRHHRRIGQRYVVKGRPADNDLHARRDVHVLRIAPVPFPLEVAYCIEGLGELQFEARAESSKVELQHSALPRVIRNLIHKVYLVVYALDVFQTREGCPFYLLQAPYVGGRPEQHGV